MNQPVISVVLPCYNGELYLRESIESVIGQSYREWELIVVDDGSQDRSPEIAEEYAKRDDRIRVIRNTENMKLPATLNRGFREARGRYLTWTSDDNFYLSRAFEVMLGFLEARSDTPMVCTGMLWVDEQKRFLREKPPFEARRLYVDCNIGACFLYRREVLEKVGEYDPEFFLVEDHEYCLRILRDCGGIQYIPEVLYLYRIHEGTLTETMRPLVKAQRRKMLVRYSELIAGGLLDDPDLLVYYYCEIAKYGKPASPDINKLKQLCPELRHDVPLQPEKDIYIYGAGDIGIQVLDCLKKLGRNAAGFIETRPKKQDLVVRGLPVISLDAYLHRSREEETQCLVSAGGVHTGEIARGLLQHGVERYTLFPSVVADAFSAEYSDPSDIHSRIYEVIK